MRRHWKAIMWFAAIVLIGSAVAFATAQYWLFYAVMLTTLISWFVLAVAWADESKPRRAGPSSPQ